MKGHLEQIFSKALYADDPYLYSVSYRDLGSIIELSLPEFIKTSNNLELIPASRILSVKKEGKVLYQKCSFDKLIDS
jgi:hypothetical protein